MVVSRILAVGWVGGDRGKKLSLKKLDAWFKVKVFKKTKKLEVLSPFSTLVCNHMLRSSEEKFINECHLLLDGVVFQSRKSQWLGELSSPTLYSQASFWCSKQGLNLLPFLKVGDTINMFCVFNYFPFVSSGIEISPSSLFYFKKLH